MDLKERCELMLVMLEEELDVLKLKQKIQQKVKVNVDKNQKEYVLPVHLPESLHQTEAGYN